MALRTALPTLACLPFAAVSLDAQLRALEGMPVSSAFDGACTFSSEIHEYVPLLYPIGFSSEGLFAFVWAEFGMVGYSESVVLHDLVTDAVTSRTTVYEDVEGTISRPSTDVEVRQLLEDHGVVPDSDIVLGAFPARLLDDVFTVDVVPLRRSEDGAAYDVFLVSDRLGRKRVSTVEVRDYYGLGRVDLAVRGYFQSPVEDRVAIVVGGVRSGFESTPSCDYALIGAHLRVGFR